MELNHVSLTTNHPVDLIFDSPLKLARKKAGLTQSEVAEKLNTSQTQLSRLERAQWLRVRSQKLLAMKCLQLYGREYNQQFLDEMYQWRILLYKYKLLKEPY